MALNDNIFYVNTASISNGDITASFKGDGSQLTSITAVSSSWASLSISASYAPVEPTYSSSVSTIFGTKQPNLVTGNTYTITSSWASNATNATTATLASTASYWGGNPLETPPYKAGKVVSASFGGRPQTSSIVFATPFADGNYSVTINGGNARAWTAESLVSGSFIISTNAVQAIDEDVYWIAIKHGESA